MNKKIFIISIFLFFSQIANAQPDLTVVGNVSVNSPNPVHVGITINVTFSVQNIGSSTAGASRTGIYLQGPAPLTEILLSEISLESLTTGASSNNIQFNFPIPYTVINSGTYSVIVKLNHSGAISESNYANNYGSAQMTVDKAPWAAQNIPYPVIFIHGYMGANTTWDEQIDSLKNFYGWSYGGNMDFCLNYDGDKTISDISSDYHDFYGEAGHTINQNPCDYYTVNFRVNPNGLPPYDNFYESNQAGVVKQGLAISDAIKHVLSITGRDKVILVGHSMGGLAAREYLQNKSIWQEPNINHHVAKLITIGTPHGGSNFIDPNGGIFPAYDGRSEAIRDLRTSYLWTGQEGAYLFDGAEDNDYMKDLPGLNFHNVNVNCNDIPSGEFIHGINNKSINTDLTYSCLIGTGDILGGDGVVSEYSANINNFRSVSAANFLLPKTSGLNTVWHLVLTKQFADIMKGMDEPNDNYNSSVFNSSHAYQVFSGQLYYGNTTYQSPNDPAKDYENYKIHISSNGNLNIQIFNITTPAFSVEVKNSSNNSVSNVVKSNGKSFINTNISITAGDYYIVFSGIPIANSYKYPYAFKCTFSAITTYCNGTTNLTATSGTFSDGSGANNYNNNSDCKWKIQPSGATSITLSFSAFNVIDPGDTVYVYDGGTTSSPLLGKWTGDVLPNDVTTTGGTLLVRFLTDAGITSPGWAANYTSVTVPTYCNGTTTLTAASGSFSDGSGVTDYGNNSNCSWLINPTGANTITLNFSSFNTETANDILNVYDGNDNTADLLGSYSGTSIPPSITSSGGSLFVEFISNNSITASGWVASYIAEIPVNTGGIDAYEYWFDSNFQDVTQISVMPRNNFQLNLNIPTTFIEGGLHVFHVRFRDVNEKWSSIISSFFYKPTTIPTTTSQYEYWFDSDFDNKSTINITSTNNFVLLDNITTSTIINGLHTLHFRFKPDGRKWSSVTSSFFYKDHDGLVPINNLAKFVYWYDNNWQVPKTISIIGTQNIHWTLNTDATELSEGRHNLSMSFKDDRGKWSSIVNDSFTRAPITTQTCLDRNRQFTSGVISGSGSTYQWQLDDGTGFVNLADNAIYSGTLTDILQLINAPTSWYGYRFRGLVTNGASTITGETYILKFVSLWNGSVDNTWENPANWSCNAVPDSNTDVYINTAMPRYPVINADATCRKLYLQPGTSIEVKPGKNLNITGKD